MLTNAAVCCRMMPNPLKKLEKYDLSRPKVSKYSLTSWPEVIVVFHGEYKRTVTHTLKISHYRVARTTASASHRVELKRTHFRDGEVRGAQFARVDDIATGFSGALVSYLVTLYSGSSTCGPATRTSSLHTSSYQEPSQACRSKSGLTAC
jgi:hypothetical protein